MMTVTTVTSIDHAMVSLVKPDSNQCIILIYTYKINNNCLPPLVQYETNPPFTYERKNLFSNNDNGKSIDNSRILHQLNLSSFLSHQLQILLLLSYVIRIDYHHLGQVASNQTVRTQIANT